MGDRLLARVDGDAGRAQCDVVDRLCFYRTFFADDAEKIGLVWTRLRATLISSTAALCIDQEAIPAETNDMGVFASLFGKLEKTYRRANLYELVSTDAGFTSEANARQVDSAGKAYMMAIKGNQPELHQEAARPLHAGEPRGHARGPRERIAAVATRCRLVPLAFVRISFVASDLRWRVASVNPLPIPRGAIYPRTF